MDLAIILISPESILSMGVVGFAMKLTGDHGWSVIEAQRRARPFDLQRTLEKTCSQALAH
jgi:hypothetical protein